MANKNIQKKENMKKKGTGKSSARAAKPISAEEQLALRNNAKAELERLLGLFSDEETKQMVSDFKETFAICEAVYKVILEEHQFNKTGKRPEIMKVMMTQVPHALAFAGYHFSNTLLDKLFGSEERIGKRSVKKLRDALTHGMKQSAVNELKERKTELYSYMDEFMKVISEFDQEAA